MTAMPIEVEIAHIDALTWLARQDYDRHFNITLNHLVRTEHWRECILLLEAHIERTAAVRHSVVKGKHWREWVAAVNDLRLHPGLERIQAVRNQLTPAHRCSIERGQWRCARGPHPKDPDKHVFVAEVSR